ncbi:metal-dependent hydrolase [Enterobacteriaceae bacterium ESL0689]|nr:metal-dependent hydrolase [Enterobacteriaceae bacterium ESL0689]
MTAEGHILFSIACGVFAKNAALTPVLAQGDWWHIIPSVVLTSLVPDIDHPHSFVGQRLPWIARPIARIFGHRGFTHSLLAVAAALTLFYLYQPESSFLPADVLQGMVLGYISHIVADMLTPAGVPLLWPCHWRFRLPVLMSQKSNQSERLLCIGLLVCTLWMPHTFAENDVIRRSSIMIQSLQDTFSLFLRQTERLKDHATHPQH